LLAAALPFQEVLMRTPIFTGSRYAHYRRAIIISALSGVAALVLLVLHL